MSEKRFTYMEQFNGFCDVYDNGKILSCMRLEYVENTVNLLNELNDECEFLEIDNEALEEGATKYAELYHQSLKENEQLKNDVYDWKASAEDYLKLGKSLKKENEQLQQELFESEYECICVNYHDNSIRRDDRIENLKEEFKERFGREFEID